MRSPGGAGREDLLEKKLQRLMCALSVAMSALALLIAVLK